MKVNETDNPQFSYAASSPSADRWLSISMTDAHQALVRVHVCAHTHREKGCRRVSIVKALKAKRKQSDEWEKMYDEEHLMWYWLNRSTGESQWLTEDELPYPRRRRRAKRRAAAAAAARKSAANFDYGKCFPGRKFLPTVARNRYAKIFSNAQNVRTKQVAVIWIMTHRVSLTSAKRLFSVRRRMVLLPTCGEMSMRGKRG